MRRCQLILELPLHYTPMVVSLHLRFPLGRSGRLFAENRIVLGNVSWQFGPSSFVLELFSLLNVGLGFDIK